MYPILLQCFNTNYRTGTQKTANSHRPWHLTCWPQIHVNVIDCKVTFMAVPSWKCLLVVVAFSTHLFDSVTLTFNLSTLNGMGDQDIMHLPSLVMISPVVFCFSVLTYIHMYRAAQRPTHAFDYVGSACAIIFLTHHKTWQNMIVFLCFDKIQTVCYITNSAPCNYHTNILHSKRDNCRKWTFQ